jgi:hypothetical protein
MQIAGAPALAVLVERLDSTNADNATPCADEPWVPAAGPRSRRFSEPSWPSEDDTDGLSQCSMSDRYPVSGQLRPLGSVTACSLEWMSECQRRSVDRAGTRTGSVNALYGWFSSTNMSIGRSGKQSS